MRFIVGGESFDLTREQVIAAMKDAPVETIQKHVVEIEGQVFPPKQVFAVVTGRARQSFTTMEAQRVLTRLGFVCRRAKDLTYSGAAWVAVDAGADHPPSVEDRLAALNAQRLRTLQAAVAGLHARQRARRLLDRRVRPVQAAGVGSHPHDLVERLTLDVPSLAGWRGSCSTRDRPRLPAGRGLLTDCSRRTLAITPCQSPLSRRRYTCRFKV